MKTKTFDIYFCGRYQTSFNGRYRNYREIRESIEARAFLRGMTIGEQLETDIFERKGDTPVPNYTPRFTLINIV